MQVNKSVEECIEIIKTSQKNKTFIFIINLLYKLALFIILIFNKVINVFY